MPREDEAPARVDGDGVVSRAVREQVRHRMVLRRRVPERIAAAAYRHGANLRHPVRADIGVIDGPAVGAPARGARPLAQPRQRLDAALARRAHRGAQLLGAVQLGLREFVVKLEIGLSQHAVGAEVHRERDRARAEVVRQVAQRAQAVLVADPLEKSRAHRVLAEPARPVQRQIREPVDARQFSFQHFGAHHHLFFGAALAAGRADFALGEDGQAFDEPGGLLAVGDPELAEDGVDRVGQAQDRVEVEDVRVLVGDQLVDVVVEVGQRAARVGRRGVGVDQVVEQGAGVAVGEVGVVLDDDLGAALGRMIEQRNQALMRQLGGARHFLRVAVHALVVVDFEVRRVECFPDESRIQRCGR